MNRFPKSWCWYGRVKTVFIAACTALLWSAGLGAQGLYYYFHAMTKALAAAGIEKLPLGDGRKADWRRDLGTLLVSNQKADGSWINENSRWWENDSVLVTSYVVMCLENIYYTFPK